MYEFAVALLKPYTLFYLLTAAGLIQLWYRRRETRRRLLLLTIPFVGLTIVSSPWVSYLSLGTLEWQYPPLDRRPADTQAIVVLAADLQPPDSVRARAELGEDSLLRCLHAAELYRQGPPCPIVVSGGKVDAETPGPGCAQVMAEFLQALGVRPDDLIVEDVSRTTFENAVECRKILARRQIAKVILVVDAVDMYRAARCFAKQGVEVTPSACHHRATDGQFSVFALIPSPEAARNCQRVWHEWLGVIWYWWHERI